MVHHLLSTAGARHLQTIAYQPQVELLIGALSLLFEGGALLWEGSSNWLSYLPRVLLGIRLLPRSLRSSHQQCFCLAPSWNCLVLLLPLPNLQPAEAFVSDLEALVDSIVPRPVPVQHDRGASDAVPEHLPDALLEGQMTLVCQDAA